MVYEPFQFFIRIGAFLFITGTVICARFLYFYITGSGGGHIQSLILASIVMLMGFMSILAAFIVDLMAVNRALLEDIQYRVRKAGIKEDGRQRSGRRR